MRFRRPVLLLALGPLFAACAAPPPPPPVAAPSPDKPSMDRIDGVYRGTSTRFQADSRACPSPGLVVLRVVGGQFQYRWNGRTQIDASVTPEGAVQGADGEIALNGRVADGRIEGDISSGSCGYHFRAVKRAG